MDNFISQLLIFLNVAPSIPILSSYLWTYQIALSIINLMSRAFTYKLRYINWKLGWCGSLAQQICLCHYPSRVNPEWQYQQTCSLPQKMVLPVVLAKIINCTKPSIMFVNCLMYIKTAVCKNALLYYHYHINNFK